MAGSFGIFDILDKRLSWLGQRQTVLARNIANADTPGYRPRDLDAGAFRRLLLRSTAAAPRATDPGHITTPAGVGSGGAKVEKENDVYEITPSGNAVIIEEQMVKAAQTQSHYQLMTNLYRKHKEMLRLAVSGGQ